MKKRREIINQILFIVVVLFIIFLLWGYGSGWFGVSADFRKEEAPENFISTTVQGVNELREEPIFQEEPQSPSDYILEQIF